MMIFFSIFLKNGVIGVIDARYMILLRFLNYTCYFCGYSDVMKNQFVIKRAPLPTFLFFFPFFQTAPYTRP